MLRTAMLAAALLLTPAAAFAHSCPSVMAAIDAAMPSATLSDADKAKVMELRAKGEELHKAGDHDGSMAALNEATELIGL